MRKTAAAFLVALTVAFGAQAADYEWLSVTKYRTMKAQNKPELKLILGAMFQTVFYAQSATKGQVICASPKPIPGDELIGLVDKEIANPSHPTHRKYTDNDHLAFVFVNALRRAGACQ